MTTNATDVIGIVIRVMPKGNELDVELPLFSTGKEIVDAMIQDGVAPRIDPEGNPYVYELFSKLSYTKIEDQKSLYDCGVQDGETLFLTPKLVAG